MCICFVLLSTLIKQIFRNNENKIINRILRTKGLSNSAYCALFRPKKTKPLESINISWEILYNQQSIIWWYMIMHNAFIFYNNIYQDF